MKKKAVAIFAYNRPSHLRRVLISLENNNIKNAFIFLDGPKNKKDKILQEDIKFLINNNPYIKLKLKHSSKNMGLAKSITNGLNYLSKSFEYITVLEDDCVPRKEFFSYIDLIIKSKNFNLNFHPICGYQLPEIEKKIIN